MAAFAVQSGANGDAEEGLLNIQVGSTNLGNRSRMIKSSKRNPSGIHMLLDHVTSVRVSDVFGCSLEPNSSDRERHLGPVCPVWSSEKRRFQVTPVRKVLVD